MKTEITLTFETDTPSHVDRVLFEAIQNAVRDASDAIDIDILTGLMVAAMKAEDEQNRDESRNIRDHRETETINLSVVSATIGKVTEPDRAVLGSVRATKIEEAIRKAKS
jgi:hypothetical protein